MDSKEGIIRSEMQSLRSVGFQLCQTGIALSVGVEIALVFIRRQSYQRLLVNNPGAAFVPWGRFLMGTLFLLVIASVFSGLVLFVRERYRFYDDLLVRQTETGVPVPPPTKSASLGVVAVFFAFPVADLLFRALYSTLAGI